MATIQVRTQEELDREEEERRMRLMRVLQAQHVEAASALSAASADDLATPAGRPAAPGQPERRPTPSASALPAPDSSGTFVRVERKVGRNEPCPCGSGKKYKHCHGALSSVE
jgi:preprotein translocase subunit SecA